MDDDGEALPQTAMASRARDGERLAWPVRTALRGGKQAAHAGI